MNSVIPSLVTTLSIIMLAKLNSIQDLLDDKMYCWIKQSKQFSIRKITCHHSEPTVRLDPFSGDIETWPRFWGESETSIDLNLSVSVINKHVFLREYLEGELKT